VIGAAVIIFSLIAVYVTYVTPDSIARKPSGTTTVVPGIAITMTPLSTTTTILPARPSIVIDTIDPVRLTGATQSWHITMMGSNLSAVQTIVLQPTDTNHQPVSLTPITQNNTQITLNLDELYPTVQGQDTYTFVINNKTTDKTIVVQDFLRSAPVQGVVVAYRNRDPQIFFDESGQFGAYLWADASLQTKVSASPQPGNVVISSDDTVEILEEAQGTHAWPVYHIRVRTNRIDGEAVIGKTGWISRWLVDGRDIPPEPTPTAIPPTAIPPTAIPPTVVLPTIMPPTAVPPTAAPPLASATAPPSPSVICPTDQMAGGFGKLYRENVAVRVGLGCMLEREQAGYAVQQFFEHGAMYYWEPTDTIFVFLAHQEGTYRVVEAAEAAALPEPVPDPNNPNAPVRGFGRVYYGMPNVHATLGASITPELILESSDGIGVRQRFERGQMLSKPLLPSAPPGERGKTIYVLYDTGRFTRYQDLYQD
jgi:hypothetical protein